MIQPVFNLEHIRMFSSEHIFKVERWGNFSYFSLVARTLETGGGTPRVNRGETDSRFPGRALSGLDHSEARMLVLAFHGERYRDPSLAPRGLSAQSRHSRVARFERSTGFEALRAPLDLDQLRSPVQRVVSSQWRGE